MPKNSTKTILIIFLIADLFLVVIFSCLYLYMKNQIIDSNDKEQQIKDEISKQESRSFMQDDLSVGKVFMGRIKEFIVGQENIVGFIKILENMVSSSGLKYEVKSVSTESNSDLDIINSEYVVVRIDVTGEWKNIIFFWRLLEKYPFKIDVDKVSLTKFSDYSANDKKIPQWLGSFEFTVVKLKDSKPI